MAVTPETIATALGRSPVPEPGSPEYEQWALYIGDAEMLIDARIEALDPTPPPDQIKIDYVVREAVVAHVKRPDAATQVTIAAQDTSISKTYRVSRGRIVITDDQWALLGLSVGGGAFAIDTTGLVGLGGHPPWCSLYFDSESVCSCGVALAGWPMYEPYDEGDYVG